MSGTRHHTSITCSFLEKNIGEKASLYMEVVYEDGAKVVERDSISKNDSQMTLKEDEYQAKLGPFSFNICSYKHEGRKFRLHVHISQGGKRVVSLLSAPFTIKAKKPITKPGTKKKKEKQPFTFKYPVVLKPVQVQEQFDQFQQFFNPISYDTVLNTFDLMNSEERQDTLSLLEKEFNFAKFDLMDHELLFDHEKEGNPSEVSLFFV